MRGIFFLFFWLAALQGIGQIPNVDEILRPPEVDENYVELNRNLWSARLFSLYKYQSFGLKNNSGKVFYRPRRPFSLGLGFSYQTLLLDVGFRLGGEGASRRFDLQTNALINRYIVGLNVQNYKGFEETNPDEFDNYRPDIRTTTVKIFALTFPNHKQISFRTLQTGMDKQKRGAGSFTYGGFLGFHKMQADSSIIPDYEEGNFQPGYEIERMILGNLGIMGGYTYIQPFSENWYVAGSLSPGIGLQFGNFSADQTTTLPVALFFEITAFAAVGINWDRLYTLLSYSLDGNFVNMQESHQYNYNSGKVKLVLGVKI